MNNYAPLPMKLSAFLHRRLSWPGAILIALLQRTPVLNFTVAADEMVVSSPIGAVLKAVVTAVASLGAMNSLAGATPLQPTTGSEFGITVNSGTAVDVFYTVNGTQTPPVSWIVSGSFPPGLNFSGLTSDGTVNVSVLEMTGTPTTPGTYNVNLSVFSDRDGGGFSLGPYSYTITVSGSSSATAPAFTTQPQSQTMTTGSPVTFTAAASGSPTPTYQWQKGGVDISGATSSSFTIASVASGDAGTYTVIATNSAGSATSNGATLTVNAATSAPSFTTQPQNQTVTAGSPVTFTATASGSPTPTYQWQKGGVDISGATSSSFTIASVASGDAGTYTVIATNSAGSATSNGATLTVTATATAPAFTTQPQNQTVTAGSSVTFTVAASGSPTPTYQWQKDGVTISGVTTPTYTIASASAGDAGTYTVVATNSAGSATSNGATLTVNPPVPAAPSITTQPIAATVSTGQKATFAVAASGFPAPAYQWQRLPAGSTTWENLNEGGSYQGVTTATLTVNAATAAMSGDQFRCVTTNATGSATSNGATLTVPGPAAALLEYPAGIAADSAGNLYVADAFNNTIQKITASGTVSTFAGTAGMAGSQDGTGAAAMFNQPEGVAVDGSGNVFVADMGNSTIRKITPDGTVTTLAGAASSRGSGDGAGSNARFNQPSSLAVDSVGNLYVADSFNATIRKIAPDGTVSTLAGTAGSRGDADGTGASAQFNNPSGVAVDSAGNVYVADTYNDTIRKVTPDGTVSTLAGSAGISGSTDLNGINALFNQPVGVAVDGAGNVYVADTANGEIRSITSHGDVTTVAGTAGIAGLGNSASGVVLFNQPRALVLDGTGNIFVADTGNAAIRKIALDHTVTTMSLAAASTGGSPPPPSSPSSPPPPSNSGGGGSSSGGGGGSGGGGAPSLWFYGALSLLASLRRAFRRK